LSEALSQEIRILRTCFWSGRDPEGRAFAPLADAYRRKGELEEAQSLVQDGLDRHPDFATGHLVAARVECDRGDLVAAREHLDRVLDLDGGNILALIDRADAAVSEGDHEGALTDLKMALRLDPGHVEARRRVDDLESGLGWELETTSLEEPEISDSGGSILTRTMGDIYASQGFYEKAVEVYEHLYERDPDDLELEARLAQLRVPLEVESAPPLKVQPSDPNTIAAYFDDLLAWVPGAVSIELPAPGTNQSKTGVSSADVGFETESDETFGETSQTREDHSHPAADSGDSRQVPEEGLEDFRLWLKSLQS
jgi:tetratricopeptide (TPR) repeat protein